MRFRPLAAVAGLVIGTCVSLAPGAAAATCAWNPTFLPVPTILNAGGRVLAADSQGGWYAGTGNFSFLGQSTHALRWQGGQVTDLGIVPGDYTDDAIVTGVNAAGTLVGHTQKFPSALDAGFRSKGTVLEPLPEPAGTTTSWASGINDAGDIVGYAGQQFQQGTLTYTVWNAVLWPASAPGTVVTLPGLPTTGQTKATSIDQDGTVLVEHYPSRTDAFTAKSLYLWRAGSARKLAMPADSPTATVQGAQIANGRVAGRTLAGSTGKGVLWDQNGTPLRPAGNNVALRAVNRGGQSIGLTGLNAPNLYGVWRLTESVNAPTGTYGLDVSADSGAIAGWSRDSTPNRPTVWTCS